MTQRDHVAHGTQVRFHDRGGSAGPTLALADPTTDEAATMYLLAVRQVRVRGAGAGYASRRGSPVISHCSSGSASHTSIGARQPQNRRDQSSPSGRGRVQRAVPGVGVPVLHGLASKQYPAIEGQGHREKHGMTRDHGARRSDTRPRVPFTAGVVRGEPLLARLVQRNPVPETRLKHAFHVRRDGGATTHLDSPGPVRAERMVVRAQAAIQLPRCVPEQLIFRAVHVRRQERRRERDRQPARDMEQRDARFLARAAARIRED